MHIKRTTYLLIFTLAVTAILLRPFLAYQLTVSKQLTKDPVALNALLQRLIKKKDEHHAAGTRELAAVAYIQRNLLPPVKSRRQKEQPDRARFFATAIPSGINTIFRLRPGPRCYALHGQFRI